MSLTWPHKWAGEGYSVPRPCINLNIDTSDYSGTTQAMLPEKYHWDQQVGRTRPLPGHKSGPERLFQQLSHVSILKLPNVIILVYLTPCYLKNFNRAIKWAAKDHCLATQVGRRGDLSLQIVFQSENQHKPVGLHQTRAPEKIQQHHELGRI